jgi:hypothetical protein
MRPCSPRLTVVLLTALLTLGIVGCQPNEEITREEAAELAEVERLDELVGQPVRMKGLVAAVISPRAFVMTDENVLILGSQELGVVEGEEIAVAGEVALVEQVDLAEVLGGELTPEEEAFLLDYENEYVVIAEEVGQIEATIEE